MRNHVIQQIMTSDGIMKEWEWRSKESKKVFEDNTMLKNNVPSPKMKVW